MAHPNFDLIDKFFAAYGKHDMAALRQVLAEDTTWVFPGRNKFSGTHRGAEGIVAFFDAMGGVMGQSNVKAETLFRGASDEYVLESQHVLTDRDDGHNLDHQWCVRWKFAHGKIVEGRHFAADQYAADEFFKQVAA
jgi:ketosteroid isomerase-like protein